MLWLLVAGSLAFAANGQLDKDQEAGLQQTRQMLENSQERQAVIDKDANMKKTDQQVRSLAGENTDDVYRLSSQIMERITHEANGDPTKLQQLMEKAQSNPEAFANSLSPDEKAKLQDLSKRVAPNKQP